MLSRWLMLTAFVAVCILGCALKVGAEPLIHPGDTIGVDVLNYSALNQDPTSRFAPLASQSIVVTGDGTISLPIVGSLVVAGKSAIQVEKLISERLSKYIFDPAVTVTLILQNPVIFLTGATDGSLTYLPGETLSTALGQLRQQSEKDQQQVQNADNRDGRSLSRSGLDLRKIVIERDGRLIHSIDGSALLRSGRPGPLLLAGDTIRLVNKPVRVDVRGQVASPGPIYLYADDTLEEALLATGGPLSSASTADASLIRNGVETPLPLGGQAIRQAPEDGDVIIVRAAPHVNVLGQVITPGNLTLSNGSGLLVALYLAGGPTRWANVRDVQVIHDGVAKTYNLINLQHGDTSLNFPLSDGDVVYVPEGHAIDARLFFQGIISALAGIYDVERF